MSRFKLWLVAVTALVVIALPSPASAANAVPFALTPSLTNAQVSAYLEVHGIDPRQAVIQRGLHNYAGPTCPGSGWTCTKRVSDVVQLGPANSTNPTNVAACIQGTCSITQTNTSANNVAFCLQYGGGPNATQQCNITQTNSTGNNSATILMVLQQFLSPTEQASQVATVTQTNRSGNNTTSLGQQIQQVVLGPASLAATQDQEGTSQAVVTQNSTNGTNTFNGAQEQNQNEDYNGPTATVSQNQDVNRSAGYNEMVTLSQNTPPPSSPGQNNSTLTQLIQQHQDIDNNNAAPGSTQTQGNNQGGLDGSTNQYSVGVATENVHQNELQVQQPENNPNITQTQFGPLHCCSDQLNNPGNTFQVNQQSTQQASANATQTEDLEGKCHTSGTCTVTQQVTENGVTTTNTCNVTDSTCNSMINCPPPETDDVTTAGANDPSCSATPGEGTALTLGTVVLDASTGGPWSGSETTGAAAIDSATLTGANDDVTPTGTVSYKLYPDGSCTAPSSMEVTVNLSEGVVPSSLPTDPLGAGTYSFQASYSGDDNYPKTTGSCEQFTVAPAGVSITTVVFDGSGEQWTGTELAPATAIDTATVTGVSGFTPTGTVTYTLYPNGSCTAPATMAVTVNLSDGIAPNSLPATIDEAGSYSFQASYSGDSNYLATTGGCEQFTVNELE
jgi:hypothetical protein